MLVSMVMSWLTARKVSLPARAAQASSRESRYGSRESRCVGSGLLFGSTFNHTRFPASAPLAAWQKARASPFSARPLPQQKLTNTTLNMNDRETRRYDMFGRVQTFGKDNATDFAAGSKATTP